MCYLLTDDGECDDHCALRNVFAQQGDSPVSDVCDVAGLHHLSITPQRCGAIDLQAHNI